MQKSFSEQNKGDSVPNWTVDVLHEYPRSSPLFFCSCVVSIPSPQVSQATTPPHGDYDYAYASNDGADHSSYQQQGGGELGYAGDGYVADGDDPAVAASDAASFGDGAGAGITGSLTEEIQRRSVSMGQLFGRSAATMGTKKQVSGLEVRKHISSTVDGCKRYRVCVCVCVCVSARAYFGPTDSSSAVTRFGVHSHIFGACVASFRCIALCKTAYAFGA